MILCDDNLNSSANGIFSGAAHKPYRRVLYAQNAVVQFYSARVDVILSTFFRRVRLSPQRSLERLASSHTDVRQTSIHYRQHGFHSAILHDTISFDLAFRFDPYRARNMDGTVRSSFCLMEYHPVVL